MERGARRRRRWGVSGIASLGAHATIVVACLVGVGPHYERVSGRPALDPTDTIIDFDLVAPAQAAPEPPPLVEHVEPRPVPRHGHTIHHARPAPDVPVRLPANADLSAPADVDDDPGEEPDDEPEAAGEPAPPPAPAPAPIPPPTEPISIPAHEATYLRTYETYPSLPRSLWVNGRIYSVLAQVCVSADGRVSDVTIKKGAAPELDRVVAQTLRSWQYRPRLIEGTPRPFCHLMKLDFTLR